MRDNQNSDGLGRAGIKEREVELLSGLTEILTKIWLRQAYALSALIQWLLNICECFYVCILPLSKQARMEREGTRKEARKEKRRKREGAGKKERGRDSETHGKNVKY